MTEKQSKQRAWRISLALTALILIIAVVAFYARWRGVSYPEYTLDFGTNQKITLRMHRRGEKMTGTLLVVPPKISENLLDWRFGFQLAHHIFGRLKRFTQPIPPGEYPMEGLFAEPRSYRMVGRFPAPLADFSIGGDLPDATQAGSYIFVAAGAIANGELPAFDGSLAAKKPAPEPVGSISTPACPNCLIVGKMKKSPEANIRDSQFSIGLRYGHLPVKRSGLWVASYVLSDSLNTQQVVFNIEPPANVALRAGQEFSLKKGSGNSLTYSEYGSENKDWDSTGGTLKIQAFNKGEVVFVLKDVPLAARSGGQARGIMTMTATGRMQATALIRQDML
jgi:hypothetical protein